MMENGTTAIIAAVSAFATAICVRVLDGWIGRNTQWRSEAEEIRRDQREDIRMLKESLERCEERNTNLVRQVNDMILRISVLEAEKRQMQHEIAELKKYHP